MQTVKWKDVQSSDAPNCDECDKPFTGGEVRLLGEFGNGHQAVVHRAASHIGKKGRILSMWRSIVERLCSYAQLLFCFPPSSRVILSAAKDLAAAVFAAVMVFPG